MVLYVTEIVLPVATHALYTELGSRAVGQFNAVKRIDGDEKVEAEEEAEADDGSG